jgi:hypothetical protein
VNVVGRVLGPLAWSMAALALVGTLGLVAASVVFGHRAEAEAKP